MGGGENGAEAEIGNMDLFGRVVINKKMIRGRWNVVLDKAINGRTIIPQANYNWLLFNPSFQAIPKGYVVHHLDHDKLNDDISNLVIMYKLHHVAYHFKNRRAEVPIEFSLEGRIKNFPLPNGIISKPRIYQEKNGYCLTWYEDGDNGKRIRQRTRGINGKKFETREEAEEAKDKLIEASEGIKG